MPHTKDSILGFLQSAGYSFELTEHAPMYTIDDMMAAGLDTKGEIIKNLFLRDSKGKRHFLVLLCAQSTAKLAEIAQGLDCGRLSFASEERLVKHLGITPGAVTPLAVLNDENSIVEVLCDKNILKSGIVGVHPCVNTATVWLKTADLVNIIEKSGHVVTYIDV